MKRISALFALISLLAICANAQNSYFEGARVLIAYFSWSGNTQRVAEEIHNITGGDLYRIEPATPYPDDYTECTEVALAERDNDARPAIAAPVDNMDDYDIVFIGCPVWWHTAPMIMSTFAESYDFSNKTIVPFCTYASTYRDETLQKLVDLTPNSNHLTGLGARSGSTSGVRNWLEQIDDEWNNNIQSGISTAKTPTAGSDAKVYDMSGRMVTDDNTANHKIYIIKKRQPNCEDNDNKMTTCHKPNYKTL